MDTSALGEGFLRIRRISPGCITVPTLHTSLHLHVALLPEGQTGEPENVIECLRKSGALDRIVLDL